MLATHSRPFGHQSRRSHGARAALLLATTALTSPLLIGVAIAQNLPTGGSVAAGSVVISQPSATQLNVTQSSQSAVVNYQSFSVGQGSSVNFAQPNASSAILNRVTGSATSSIAGSITANGSVYLVNPNGIAITSSGSVNVGGGFVASTLGISDSDFMAGKRTFTGNGASARVSNEGTINVGRGGYAALIGGTVSNAGSINVPLGKVGLGSGEQATLDFSGDGFLQVAMPTSAGGRRALITNSGTIKADGGSVIISAATAREAARNAINISGVVQARSIGGRNGSISIGGGQGGSVKISGRLIATSRAGTGGNINVTGRDIKLKGAVVDASGKTGGGAINIGGGRQGAGPLQRARTTTIDAATTIKADATTSGNGGNVVVWSDQLTTFAGNISARGGALSGNGGEAEVSGKAKLGYTGFTNLSATNGRFGNLLLDPYNVIISNGADTGGFTATADDSVINATTLSNALGGANVTVTTGLSGSPGTQDGNITVAAPVAWSAPTTLTLDAANAVAINATISVQGAGGVAINAAARSGVTSTGLTFGNGGSIDYGTIDQGGTFRLNGTNYMLVYSMANFDAIDGLNASTGAGVATFGSGLTGNYALATNLDASGTGYGQALIGGTYSGMLDGLGHSIANLSIVSGGGTALIADNAGTISNFGLRNVAITGFSDNDGTLAQFNSGIIQTSYADGVVAGQFNNGNNNAGGLVADNSGTIQASYANVQVFGSSNAGGLVGRLSGGAILNSYATGAVIANNIVGGLVGSISGGTVTQSYATGYVQGGNAGGLFGFLASFAPDSNGNYWNSVTSGQANAAGLDNFSHAIGNTALGTADFQNGSLPGGLPSPIWSTGAGLYPYLTNFYPSTPVAVTGNAYRDTNGTALRGANVGIIAGGSYFGTSTTGNDGYYYITAPGGSLTNGASLLAYSSSAGGAATLSSVTSTTIQAGPAIYNGAIAGTTAETTLTAAETPLIAAATAAAGVNANALAAISGATGRVLTATGDSFTVDRSVTTAGVFGISTLAGKPLTVNSPVTVSDGIALGYLAGGAIGLNSGGTLAINAPVTAQGSVTVALGYDAATPGNLSFAIGAPLTFMDSGGNAISSSTGGTLSVNGVSQTLIYNVNDLQNINSGLTGHYALANNLDASGVAGFIPIGTDGTAVVDGSNVLNVGNGFTGAFTGLGHTIDSLSVAQPNARYVGLFGYVGPGGLVQNVGLTNATIQGNSTLGTIAGFNFGTVTQSYSTGRLVTTQSGFVSGGLIGENAGTLSQSFSTVAVNARDTNVGGGAVGFNGGTIDRVYAMGAVDIGSGGQHAGGLVGVNLAGTISDSYATGAVSGGATVGGFVGQSFGGTVSGAFDTLTSGNNLPGVAFNTSAGTVVGLSTTSFQNGGASGLSAAYGGGANGLYPYLNSFYPIGVQAISGIAYKDAGVTLLTSGVRQPFGYPDPGYISAARNGNTLGTVTTGYNGYYYIALPNGTLVNGASVVSYTQADPGGSGARNAATVATANGGVTLANADVFGGTITQATSATSMSTALSLADARIAANSAAGNVAKANAAINATFGLGFIASGASFNVDNTSGLDTLYVRTNAGAPITVSSAVNFANTGGGLGLFSGGALAVNAPITVGGGTVGLAASLDTTTAQGVSLLNLSFGPGASIDYGAVNNGGTLSINGQSYSLIYSMAQLAAIDGSGGLFAIATNLTPSSGYTGSVVGSFGGILTGLGHSITNLSITNAANAVEVGLIGTNSGVIRDLHLVGGSVTTTGDANIGALVGYNLQGVIANVSSSATVTGTFLSTGGLVGRSYAVLGHSAIVNASATGAVSVTNAFVGGLVGFNESRNNYVATIANSFATGMVSATTFGYAGGLVGVNQAVDGGKAPIANSFATGAVYVLGSSSVAGGLVGSNAAARGGSVASLTNVYATGPVSGSTAEGLIGINYAFDVATTPLVNAYWNTTTSGRSNGIGTDDAGVAATALTTSDLQSGALPAGFSSSLWTTGNGLYPYLTSFFPNGIQVVTGTAFTDAGLTPASGANALRSVGVIAGGTSFGTSALGADGSYYVFGAAGTIAGGATLLAHNNTNGATLATASGASVQNNFNIYGNALTIPTTATLLSAAPSLADAQTTAIAAAGGNIAAQTAINASTGRGFFATSNAGFTIDESVAIASGSTFVVQTTAGSPLTVSNGITVDGTGSFGLLSSGRLAINAPINVNGTGGVNLAFDTSSPTNLSFAIGSSIDYGTTNNGGRLAINGANYALLYNMTDIGTVNNALAGNYALATNLDAGGMVYTTALIAAGNPSAILPTPFSGTFDGLGHIISNLTISSSDYFVGLIGNSTGTVRNIGLIGGSVSGFGNVGGLVGYNAGVIAQAYATGDVVGGFGGGGLVGTNTGVIVQSYATGSVNGVQWIGGLVGYNLLGSITKAFATGAVRGSQQVGGLVGGSVVGSITNVYATGAVNGDQQVGGLVGEQVGGSIINGYFDTQTSGQSSGGVGLTTRQLQGLDPINGNAFSVVNNLGDGATSAFSGGAGGLYPYLKNFFPNGVQAVSGIVYADAGNTPLASGATGAVQVGVIGNNAALGTATTGANGYYYVFGAAGMLNSGNNILAFTNASTDANGTVVAKSAVTLAAAAGALIETGVHIYGDALTINTTANALSAAPSLADARTSATTAAGGDANALAAISGAQGQSFIATNGDFVIDRAVTTANTFRVQTTAANAAITAVNAVTINDGGSLGLLASGALRVNAPITINGAVAVNLAYDASSLNALLMNFSFESGRSLTFNGANGNPTATAVAGQSLAVNGQNYALLYSMADVDGVDGLAASSNPINVQAGGNSGLYALAHSLDATGVTYTDALIGNYAGTLAQFRFTGTFQGLGHTITGLTINKNDAFAGLFGVIGSETVLGQNGVVRDIGLIGGSVAGTNQVGPLAGYNHSRVVNGYATGTASATHSVGGLVGTNSGSMMYAHATGAVTAGTSAGGLVGVNVGYIADAYATGAVRGDVSGGLVGNNNNGTITNSYATGSVTGFYAIGGLVGQNHGDGGILNSFATGAVAGSLNVGGLVGVNGGLYSYEHGGGLLNVYATGSVIGYSSVGGLVGYNGSVSSTATVTNAYATGAVSGQAGGSDIGGLIGLNDPNGTVTAGYYDRQTTGQSAGIGLDNNSQTTTSLTTAALQNGALPAGFDPAVWATGSGLYPYLASFFPNGVQVVSGTAYADAIGTPLASNAGGAVTVNVVGGGKGLGSRTTGANGYYYAFGQPGTIADGAALLAYIDRNNPAGAKDSVTLATTSGTPVNGTSTLQTGVNLYNGAFAASTSELTLSAAEPAAIAALNAALNANFTAVIPAALPAAVGAVAGGRYYTATGASFTIDTPVTTSNIFAVSTVANAPLTVSSPITINAGGSLGLLSGGALAINAAVNVNGAASVALGYDASSATNLSFGLTGSGFTGSLTYRDAGGIVQSTSPGNQSLTINGQSYALLYSMTDVEQQNISGFNAIANNLDASATTYTSAVVGNFSGTLEGLGHTIGNLTITGNSSYVGLIGLSSGSVRDLGLVGGSVSGGDFSSYLGSLVGFNNGTIAQSYVTGTVSAGNFSSYLGGLAGYNNGTIAQSFAIGAVSAGNLSSYLGGLVGFFNVGTITQSFATGAISAGDISARLGGLVGYNNGTIAQSYATGVVSAGINSSYLGGLAGDNNGTIAQSYATGAVSAGSGSNLLGGLTGISTGTVTNGYYDVETTGRSLGVQPDDSVGLTTAQLQSNGLASLGFNPAVWDGATSGLYPYLTSFFPKGVQAVSGFAYTDGGVTPLASAANGAATVSIAGNGQTLSSVTTGANGYYYAVVPAGTLGSNGVAAYTQADAITGAADAVSYLSGTPGTVTNLDISGGWRRDATLLSSLSTLDAGFAATTGGTPVAVFTLPNRSIFAVNDFTLNSALNVAGTLNLASVGNVTQTSAFSAGTLLLEGGTSTSFTLTNTGNQFGRLAAFGGAIAVSTANSLTIAANASTACGCVVTGVLATGSVRIATAGDLTIEAGAGVIGDSPVLAAAGAFINNAGANAVTATSGRWLVYSADPAGNTFGDLDSGNTAVWSTAAGATVTPAGNRYAFAAQRTLTVTSLSDSKTYGEDVTSRVATDYAITGFEPGVAGAYLADTASTAYSGAANVTSSGAAATANIAGSPYTITASLGSLASDSGYGFAFANSGLLTVMQRGISVTADAQSRIYGDANPVLTYAVGGLGLANGDTLFGSLATPATATSNVGIYAITQGSLAASSNYAMTYAGANLGVTARPLTVTADAQSRIYGNPNPPLTYAVGGRGLVNGDTLSGSLATPATPTSDAGTYDITQGTLAATPNYSLTYRGNLLTVTRTPLSLIDVGLLASSVVRDATDWIVLPDGAKPLSGVPPITTTLGTGVFYADPRFDQVFICFGGGGGAAPSCVAAR